MEQTKTLSHRFGFIVLALIFIVPHVWSIYFNQNYVNPKRCLTEFIVGLVSLLLALEPKVFLPAKRILITSAVLLGLKVLITAIHPTWVSAFSLLEAIAFGVLCVYLMTIWKKYNLQLKDIYWIFAISALGISAEALYQYMNSRVINGDNNPLFYAAFFGNINMMGEFLVLLLPLGIYYLRTEKEYRGHIAHIIVTSWIFLILVAQSRSTWIGLGFIFLYGVFKKLTVKEWASFAIAFALYVGTWWIPGHGQEYSEAKRISFNKRADIYPGVFEMLADQPIGVGGGQFEFNFIPYQMETKFKPTEALIFNTPHSEPLKWGIENGWAFLLTQIIWWALFALFILRIPGTTEAQTFYRTTFLALISPMCFQFPFDNPATYLALGFLFAVTLAQGPFTEFKISKPIKALLIICSVLLFAKNAGQTNGRWVESQLFNDKDALLTGCQFDPTNYKTCYYLVMVLSQNGQAEQGLVTLKDQLRQRPFQYHMLRALAFYHISKNSLQPSCEIARVYNTMFTGQSMFTDFVNRNCASVPNPISFYTGAQYREEYLKWLKKYL